jgi:hypothetical protein
MTIYMTVVFCIYLERSAIRLDAAADGLALQFYFRSK